MLDWNTGTLQTRRIARPTSREGKRRNANITGTSPRASVSDTNVWQLAVLPRVDAYCGATPTERSPFFGIAVSSMTKHRILATDEPVGLSEAVLTPTAPRPRHRQQ